ncbi:hypothetical protein AB1I63_02445 [Streptococcus pneumoniae]
MLPKLNQANQGRLRKIYYLNTSGIDSKAYKTFAKKYQIKSPIYLAHFGQRKELSHLSNLENSTVEMIQEYLGQE